MCNARGLTLLAGRRRADLAFFRYAALLAAVLAMAVPAISFAQNRTKVGELRIQKRSCESRESVTVTIRDRKLEVIEVDRSYGGERSRQERQLTDQDVAELESILEFWNLASTPVSWPDDLDKCAYSVSWSGKRAKYSWNKRTKMIPSSIAAIWDWASKRADNLYGSRRFYYHGRGGGRDGHRGGGLSRPQARPHNSTQDLPDFPFPPPAASTLYVLPRDVFPDAPTIGQVTLSIISALERNGYVERGFFRTQPDGIALVTRLERINDDGTPYPEANRWPAQARDRTLGQILWSLFYVDPGRYRVIVFVLNDVPFSTSGKEPTSDEAREWLRTGANALPSDIADESYGSRKCTGLVYEFSSDGRARLVQSSVTAKQHLEKSGVLQALASSK
jgi:hypothetical protein